MNQDAIRMCNTSADDLEICNVGHFMRIFGELSKTPRDAKQFRSKVILGFPSYDQDPRPNHQIPAIRRFVRSLDEKLPHFLYFLVGDPTFGHIQFYLLCLLDLGGEGESTVSAKSFYALLRRKESDLRRFCDVVADDPDSVVKNLFMALPIPLVREIPGLAQEVLASMRPALQAIESDLATKGVVSAPPSVTPQQAADSAAELLRRAASLAGLDRAGGESDLDHVRRILAQRG